MRAIRYKPLFLVAAFLFGLIGTDSFGAEALIKRPEKTESKPIIIKSKTLEVNDKNKVIIFQGDVSAEVSSKGDDFVIDCQKMFVYYKNQPSQQQAKAETRIDRIVATGNVVFKRSQGGMATSEKAVYYQEDEKIVLTGNPVIKQAKDLVEGDTITVFLEENRHVVESIGEKKVRAIIFPKRGKR
jgi:lipopolysaccharide export system protein LptA